MFNQMILKFRSNFARGYARAKAERAEFLSKVNPFSPAAMVATWFGSGLLLPGPGTWGTLAGFLSLGVVRLLPFSSLSELNLFMISVTLILFIAGWVATAHIEKKTGTHDLSLIVIDEVAAVWMLATCMPIIVHSNSWALAAFVIFRIFDIWKPWPIRWADRRVKGAWGVMLDDLLAALYSCIVLFFALMSLFFTAPEF